jgi:hypothetical protein
VKTDLHNRLRGIRFDPEWSGRNELPLAVAMYFSKGTKYTNVWRVANDGTRMLLTPQPVFDHDYEYHLYRRAAALYAQCPSDGYELERFGRILSTPATVSGSACGTWVKVTYAAGQQGYIDISDREIRKLSDADFPFFMGWQKVSAGSTPFGSDGLCDMAALKKLVKDAADHETPTVAMETFEVQKDDALSRSVKANDQGYHDFL